VASSAAYYSQYNKATHPSPPCTAAAVAAAINWIFCSRCRRKPPLDSGQIYCPMVVEANACGVLLAWFIIERIFLLRGSVIHLAYHYRPTAKSLEI